MTGVFFGSFDPVHIGHINVVTAALSSELIDKVIVIPAYKSVWKNTETPYKYRLMMTVEAFKEIPNVVVSDVELRIGGGKPLPTCDVIDHLKESIGEFCIVTTAETYTEIPYWQRGEEIMKDNTFLVVEASHFDNDYTLKDSDYLTYAPNITMCSSSLRQKLAANKLVQPFIPDKVLGIIEALNLYD